MAAFDLNASMCIRPKMAPASAWTGHIPFAAWLVEELQPRRLVELGTHNGASYLSFCQAVRENKLSTECFAVDTWQGDEHAGYYGDEVFTTLWEYNQKHYAGFSQLMRMTFDEAVGCFEEGSVDLLHIDGLHTYEAVRHDYETWLSKLSHRGVILFHDTQVRERNFGVWRLWEEISGRYPSFEFQHTHGLGVLLVGSDLPESVRRLASAAGGEDGVGINRIFERLGEAVRSDALAESLGLGVSARDVQIAESVAAVQERDVLIGHLRQGLADREKELATNSQQAVAREEVLAQLNRMIADRDGQLSAWSSDLAQRLAGVEASAASQTAAWDLLRVEISDRLSRGETDRHMLQDAARVAEARLVETRARVEELEGLLAGAQEQSRHQGAALAGFKAELAAVLGSRSWRITRPLRWLRKLHG